MVGKNKPDSKGKVTSSEKAGKVQPSVLAKTDDGTIQVTFTLPWSDVEKVQEHVYEEEGQKITIPGFRPGKAPLAKVKEKIPQSTIIEHTLRHFYNYFIGEIVNIHKVKPAIYPRIEVLKALDGQDWEVRAVTCELPDIQLGDYRKLVMTKAKIDGIWTPEKGKKEDKKEVTKEQKEQAILKALVENIKLEIPKLLIEEEVSQRLSQLLARIEKLGLQLEAYLASVGKNVEGLRKEYEEQAKNAISIELILGAIADTEGVKADDAQVDETIKAAAAGQADVEKRLNTPEQRSIIKNVLQRRTILDSLIALI